VLQVRASPQRYRPGKRLSPLDIRQDLDQGYFARLCAKVTRSKKAASLSRMQMMAVLIWRSQNRNSRSTGRGKVVLARQQFPSELSMVLQEPVSGTHWRI
jgi:hypothetical protein